MVWFGTNPLIGCTIRYAATTLPFNLQACDNAGMNPILKVWLQLLGILALVFLFGLGSFWLARHR